MHWREKELYEILLLGGRLKTTDIIEKSRMCKVTALKYLNSLLDAGLVKFDRIGPTKLWQINGNETSKGEEDGSPNHFKNILRMLKEYEETTGKKAFVIMSAEDLETNPVGLKVSLLDAKAPSIELETKAGG